MNFFHGFTVTAVKMSVFPYILPSYFVNSTDPLPDRSREDLTLRNLEDAGLSESVSTIMERGLYGGTITGLGMDVVQAYFYSHCFFNGHPEALLLPTVTNALSGAYEVGKWLLRR